MAEPTTDIAGGEWLRFKGKLREMWGSLTDNDLDRYQGKLDQLVGYIEKATGKARLDVQRDVERLARDNQYRFDK